MVQLIQKFEQARPKPIAGDGRELRIWGFTPRELHDAFWRSKGVQCVRRGERSKLQRAAELFLLIEPDELILFNIARMSERLTWRDAAVTHVKLLNEDQPRYSEHVVTDERGLVQRIERRYRPPVERSTRVMITSYRRIASAWMVSKSRREACRRVRRLTAWTGIDHWRDEGYAFRAGDRAQENQMLEQLVMRWKCPCQVIDGLEQIEPGVWHIAEETIPREAVLVGPMWIGRGGLRSPTCAVGPAWFPDAPSNSHADEEHPFVRNIEEIEPLETPTASRSLSSGSFYPLMKRAIDVIGSVSALVFAFPIMVIVAVCILIEDGRPLFFGHSRQGRGGKVFRCWKFRTMHRNAHAMVHQLAVQNVCDGPQVYIKDDPRVTRVGRFLRKANLDELPQFWNVLAGHMSLVGPRPSPDKENQYCPAWRDLRLSVRPGITGLWQLNRTRRKGSDFQEWIKYDIQYVQQASFWFDLKILLRTVKLIATGRS